MSTVAILQARMTSSRLPGKVMLEINNKPMIYWQAQRILQVKEIDKVVVATSLDESDDSLEEYLTSVGLEVFRGSLVDVHSRFLCIINSNPNSRTFLRLTGDCPLVMPLLVSEMLSEFNQGSLDYYSNILQPTYPDGLDVEIFSRDSFLTMSRYELSSLDKEHVTLRYRDSGSRFNIANKSNSNDLSNLRWTVDYEEDYLFVKGIFEHFRGSEPTFTMSDVLFLLESHPEINTQLPSSLRNVALFESRKKFR
jgi:spore coat polysaccharide biosynthesis protein SpsF (cytidylyltransferase family)